MGFFCPEGTGDVYEVDGLLPNGDPNYKFLCPPGFSCKNGIKPRVNFVAYIIWVQKLLLRVKANFAFSCKKLYMIYTVYLLIFVVVHFASQLDCSQSQRSILMYSPHWFAAAEGETKRTKRSISIKNRKHKSKIDDFKSRLITPRTYVKYDVRWGNLQYTVRYPLFCKSRNRKSYRMRGALENKGYINMHSATLKMRSLVIMGTSSMNMEKIAVYLAQRGITAGRNQPMGSGLRWGAPKGPTVRKNRRPSSLAPLALTATRRRSGAKQTAPSVQWGNIAKTRLATVRSSISKSSKELENKNNLKHYERRLIVK